MFHCAHPEHSPATNLATLSSIFPTRAVYDGSPVTPGAGWTTSAPEANVNDNDHCEQGIHLPMTITGLDKSMIVLAPPGLRIIFTPPSLELILYAGVRVKVKRRAK